MNLPRNLTFVVVAVLYLSTSIQCTTSRDRFNIKRYKDIAEALNLLRETVGNSMPLDARCRRYAVLISMFEATGALHNTTVKHVATLDDYMVNSHFQELDNTRLISMYTYAIDRYRASKLAPAMIDLLDCLRHFHTYAVGKYLSDKELITIENLYRRLLKSPGIKFDWTDIDMVEFHPTFKKTLKNLFGPNLKDEDGSIAQVEPQLVRTGPTVTSNLPAEPGKQSNEKDLIQEPVSEKLFRNRELDRLRQRRMRILEPDECRERERIRYRKRREKIREAKRPIEPQIMQLQVEEEPLEGDSDEVRLKKQVSRYMKIQMEQQQRRLRQNQRLLELYGHTRLPSADILDPQPTTEAAPIIFESFDSNPLEQQPQQLSERMPPESMSQLAAGSLASFTSFPHHMHQQSAWSATSPGYTAYITPDQPAMQRVPQDLSWLNEDPNIRYPYQGHVISLARDATSQSEGMISTLGIPEVGIQEQPRLHEDLATSSNQLGDANTLQSVLRQPSLGPDYTSVLTDDERAAIWLEFDRKYEDSIKGESKRQL